MRTTEWGDLHCHTSMKPFHASTDQSKRPTMGKKFGISDCCSKLSCVTRKLLPATDKESQASLQQCRKASLSVMFNALYPVEIPWFDLPTLITLFINEKNAFCCMSDFDTSVMDEWFVKIIHDKKRRALSYFDHLRDEYRYITSQEAQSTEYPFTIIKTWADYQKNKALPLINRPTAIINSIEGGHCLFNLPSYNFIEKAEFDVVNNPQSDEYKMLIDQASVHIREIKKWEYPPVFITLAHHFWNFIVGHAASISSGIINQKEGLDRGFTALGREVLSQLMGTHNGSSILIDIKHLSPKARKEFYQLRIDFGYAHLPILASHAAVAGITDAEDTCKTIASQVFQNGEINLFDSDIEHIVSTSGLIGIMMEEGRLLNKNLMETINLLAKEKGESFKQHKLAEIVIAQVLYIVDKGGVGAWDCVCIGSDFDGMINSLDSFPTVESIPSLFEVLLSILENNEPILKGLTTFDSNGCTYDCLYSSQQVYALKYGFSAQELIEKLQIRNIERFIQLSMK